MVPQWLQRAAMVVMACSGETRELEADDWAPQSNEQEQRAPGVRRACSSGAVPGPEFGNRSLSRGFQHRCNAGKPLGAAQAMLGEAPRAQRPTSSEPPHTGTYVVLSQQRGRYWDLHDGGPRRPRATVAHGLSGSGLWARLLGPGSN